MSARLILQLSLQLTVSVAAFLPAPHARMIAEEASYILHWYCNYTQLETPVTFTAEYNLWEERDDESSYTRVCVGSSECLCDFTHCALDFSLAFAIRVRADAGLLHSDWTIKKFTPDEDVVLMPPSVDVTAGGDVLTLTLSQSVLSNPMELQYRVQYWERLKPQQNHTEVHASPHVPLRPLRSCTEYCVRVSVFSPYDISSNYSSPRCESTTGCPFGWLAILVGLPGILGAFVCYKFRRRSPVYTAPESIQVFTSAPSLLEVQEECWAIAHVIPPATEQEEEEEEELDPAAEPQAPASVCQCSGGSVQDSGFSSGLESQDITGRFSKCVKS